jgi:hypothetical protein
MRTLALTLVSAACHCALAKTVSLSNVELPLDTQGNPLTTGELTVLAHGGAWYAFFNDWGGCPGVNCCPSGSCAGCCFNPPSARCVTVRPYVMCGWVCVRVCVPVCACACVCTSVYQCVCA